MKKNTRKAKKQRRTLTAAAVLALLITAGGTFAWFTSKDEVTNRLTASNDYGVKITETFTPPSQWTPGQEINKDVSLVNTGNVDALARVSLDGAMDLTIWTTSDTFDKDKADKLTDDEAKAMQAGRMLVVAAGESVEASKQAVGTDYKSETDGIYVFRRSEIDDTTGSIVYKYSGYYKSGTDYYAIDCKVDSDSTYEDKAVGNEITVSYKVKEDVESPTLTWNYSGLASTVDPNNTIKVTYDPDSSTTGNEIVINVNLKEGWEENFELNGTTNKFYYKKVLQSGTTSDQLVDSVTLDSSVTENAYANFDFDLNVIAESVQVVTKGEDNKQSGDAATSEWNDEVTSVTFEPEVKGTNASSVTWGFVSSSAGTTETE